MKRRIFLCIILFLLLSTSVYSKDFYQGYNTNTVLKFRDYICLERKHRAIIYNALSLSDEQICQREKISESFLEFYDEKFKILEKEAKKLDVYEKMEYSFWRIHSQKCLLQKLRNEIMELLNEENRLFSSCLTREQSKKLKAIRILERKELNDFSNKKNYYKSNPKMKTFGDEKIFKQAKSRLE